MWVTEVWWEEGKNVLVFPLFPNALRMEKLSCLLLLTFSSISLFLFFVFFLLVGGGEECLGLSFIPQCSQNGEVILPTIIDLFKYFSSFFCLLILCLFILYFFIYFLFFGYDFFGLSFIPNVLQWVIGFFFFLCNFFLWYDNIPSFFSNLFFLLQIYWLWQQLQTRCSRVRQIESPFRNLRNRKKQCGFLC